jgi:hypothetical protein
MHFAKRYKNIFSYKYLFGDTPSTTLVEMFQAWRGRSNAQVGEEGKVTLHETTFW